VNAFDHDLGAIRLPPHSVEAEQSVLGGLLLENNALDRIVDMLIEQDFYRADHRAIWRQITRLVEENKPADVVTVAEALESLGTLDEIGGLAYLAALAQNTPSSANIRRYAEIVGEKAALRTLGNAAMALEAAIYSRDGRTPSEIAREAQATLDAIADPARGSDEPQSAAEAITQVLLEVDEAKGRAGLHTGLPDFDALTGGLEPGQLVVIAARPSVGKTAVALAIARNVARSAHHAAFFSLEMGRHELAARLLAAEARVPARCLRTGPDDSQWHDLARAATAPGLDGLFLDDRPAASVAYVRAKCRRLAREGLSMAVVDYLQLMSPADPKASRTEQVGSLSRGLKAMAKELHVPIIALSQLNRASEARADKKPQLSDLRDSGEVEQDADMVLLLSKASPDGDVIECNLAKHRAGPTGTFWMDFDQPTMTFRPRYGAPEQPKRESRGFNERS